MVGHTDQINSVCFSPNGQLIASGSGASAYTNVKDCSVRIWDWKTQKEIAKLEAYDSGVNSVCFSPDGLCVATGSESRGSYSFQSVHYWVEPVRIWDWKIQKVIADFYVSVGVNSVCFSPDGRYVACGSKNDSVEVWDWNLRWKKVSLVGHTHWVRSVYFSPDGQYIVSGSQDNSVRVWDWEAQEKIAQLDGHTGVVNSVCFSPDGQYVVSGSDDKSVCVWDWKTQKKIVHLDGHTSIVRSVCVSPDGQQVVSGSGNYKGDYFIRVWDWKNAEKTPRLDIHADSINSLCFSPDGKHVVSGSYGKSVRVWDSETQKEIHRFEGHKCSVNSVCISPCGNYIASGSGEYTGYGARCDAADNSIRVWNMREEKEIAKLYDWMRSSGAYVQSVRFSPDGKRIATGYATMNDVIVWDWENHEKIVALKGHQNTINSVCYSPNGRYIASGSGDLTTGSLDYSTRVWNWVNQNEVARFDGHTCPVYSVCFSPDGRYVASASGSNGSKWSPNGDEGAIRIWDLESKEEIVRLDTYASGVNDICFSSDEKFIVFGAWDGTVCVWEWKKQTQIIILNAEESINSCVFSSNNHQIAVGGSSDKILIYDIENLSIGIAIVTALRNLDNNLNVRCSYCSEVFDIHEDKLGNIVKCPHCDEELQLNDFTADPIIIEDEIPAVQPASTPVSSTAAPKQDFLKNLTKR